MGLITGGFLNGYKCILRLFLLKETGFHQDCWQFVFDQFHRQTFKTVMTLKNKTSTSWNFNLCTVKVQLSLLKFVLSHSWRKKCVRECDSWKTAQTGWPRASSSSKHRPARDQAFCLWTMEGLVKAQRPCRVTPALLLSLATRAYQCATTTPQIFY